MENLIILKLKFMFSKTHHKYKKKKKPYLQTGKRYIQHIEPKVTKKI